MPWTAEHLPDGKWCVVAPTREDVDYLSDLAERAGAQLGTSRTEDGGRTTFRVDRNVLRALHAQERLDGRKAAMAFLTTASWSGSGDGLPAVLSHRHKAGIADALRSMADAIHGEEPPVTERQKGGVP